MARENKMGNKGQMIFCLVTPMSREMGERKETSNHTVWEGENYQINCTCIKRTPQSLPTSTG